MKLISFSVYGDDPLYWKGMLANIEIAKLDWPDWTVRVYSEDKPYAKLFKQAGAQVFVGPMPGIWGMFARFLPIADPRIERVIVRDADSRLNPRDKAAVDAWIASGKTWHVMRDHEHHANWSVMAGMFGAKGGSVPDLRERIARWGKWDSKLQDMMFLQESLWPQIQCDMLHHSSVPTPHLGAVPFPPHEPFNGFVGEIIHVDQPGAARRI